jgi:hypothetical protein
MALLLIGCWHKTNILKEEINMTYTVMLDFWIDEDGIRTDEEVEEILKEIFDYSGCSASNVRVIEVND